MKYTDHTLPGYYNSHSLVEYNTLLNLYNVTVYEVRESVGGKEDYRIMHGMLDNDDRQVEAPFKSSKFGKAFR